MNSKLVIDRLIARIGELPPMPQVAQKALALIRDPDSNMEDLARVLAVDEAMTSLVLRWANSSYYGLKYPVTTVRQAVTMLGHKAIHSLILAGSLASLLERPVPGYGLDRGQLWRHSIGVAAGARLVATPFGTQIAEEAYHAGLLCDIGKLALEILMREIDGLAPEWQIRSFTDIESAYFGFDHAALGAEMARRWNLPEALVNTIAYHHKPSEAPNESVIVDAVHVADTAMMIFGVGLGKDGLQYKPDPTAFQHMKVDETQLKNLLDQVLPYIDEADSFLSSRSR
jgi:putative nucleotidyltransferase with HDIG domain